LEGHEATNKDLNKAVGFHISWRLSVHLTGSGGIRVSDPGWAGADEGGAAQSRIALWVKDFTKRSKHCFHSSLKFLARSPGDSIKPNHLGVLVHQPKAQLHSFHQTR
jgi:hypothetical protein